MGNCATCRLLRKPERVHHASQADECEAQEDLKSMIMISSLSSTLLTKEPLISPLPDTELLSSHVYHLKPIISPSSFNAPLVADVDFIKQSLSKPVNLFDASQTEDGKLADYSVQPPPCNQNPSKAKAAKKVRFAMDLVQTPSSNHPISRKPSPPEGLPTCRTQETHQCFISRKDITGPETEEQTNEDISTSLPVKDQAATPCDNIMKEREEVSGVMRVKVVISKKQLSELMSITSSTKLLWKQAGDAFVQKMVSPPELELIATSSPQAHQSAKSAQSWKPSLECIAEAHCTKSLS